MRRVIHKLNRLVAKLSSCCRRQPDYFLPRARGIIHVGANTGQEAHTYAAHNLNVLWIEPIPEIFSQLRQNVAPYPRQQALNCLVTDVDGKEYDFHISNNQGASSSIYELAQHQQIWPEVQFTQTLKLISTSLPTLLAHERIDTSLYDALVMDTQGSELLVLKGACAILPGIRFVQAEVADFESYAGCCKFSELDEFLSSQGFQLAVKFPFVKKAKIGAYYDVVYEAAQKKILTTTPH